MKWRLSLALVLGLSLGLGAARAGDDETVDRIKELATCMGKRDDDCVGRLFPGDDLVRRQIAAELGKDPDQEKLTWFRDAARLTGRPRFERLMATGLIPCARVFDAALADQCETVGKAELAPLHKLPKVIDRELGQNVRSRHGRVVRCRFEDEKKNPFRIDATIVEGRLGPGGYGILDMACLPPVKLKKNEVLKGDGPDPEVGRRLLAEAMICLDRTERPACVVDEIPLTDLLFARAIAAMGTGPITENKAWFAEVKSMTLDDMHKRRDRLRELIEAECGPLWRRVDARCHAESAEVPEPPKAPSQGDEKLDRQVEVFLRLLGPPPKNENRQAARVRCGPDWTIVVWEELGDKRRLVDLRCR